MILVKTILLLLLVGLMLGDDKSEDVKDEHSDGNYFFEYGVNDPHTHDKKSQWEHREGEYVTGEYTLVEPDGSLRIVKYKAGPHTGFEAHVEHVKQE